MQDPEPARRIRVRSPENRPADDSSRASIWRRRLAMRPGIQWHLQAQHQGWVAVILACGMMLLVGRWSLLAWQAQGLIDIDRTPGIQIQFQVEVNRAPWYELAALPGIGETLARRIVEERERNGPYQSNADLVRVPGLGPQTLASLAPYLAPRSSEVVPPGNQAPNVPPRSE